MGLVLIDEFRAILDALEARGVECAVVGAMALAVHGVVRATTDIDLLVCPADVDRALAAVATAGYVLPAERMTFSSGVTVQRVTKVRDGESLTLDLLLADGPLLPAWESRQTVAAGDRRLRVVSREALITMKALSGRLRDLADIRRLQGEDEDGDG